MFKKSMLIAIFAAFTMTTQSQDISFGLKVGSNFSTITGNDNYDYDTTTGLHGGLVAQVKLSDKFSVQPEVIYSLQGGKNGYDPFYDVDFETKNTSLKLGYINVPVLAEYFITSGLSAQLGPQIGFLVNNKFEVEYNYQGEDRKMDNSLNNSTNDLDFALAGGLEYQLSIGIFFDARYNLGLSNISENNRGEIGPDAYNSTFQLSVGYMF